MSLVQIIQQHENALIDPKTQARLNQPLPKAEGIGPKNETFLEMLIRKLESGELDPMKPSTLFNQAIYERLIEADQEATDLTAINLMGILKQIQMLWLQSHQKTFQLQNLVDTVFQMKSKFEEKHGDVFKI